MSDEFGYSERRPVSPDEREDYLAFAIHLAERAGEAILPCFRQALGSTTTNADSEADQHSAVTSTEVENKAHSTAGQQRYDPVTQADRQAEALMRELIAGRYPEHGVFGEEYGFMSGSGLTWVLDPIDGTRGFVMGLLHWGTLVALFDGQQPVVGVMHQPFLRETFVGDGTRAFYRRGGMSRSIRTRSCESLATALCASTSPDMFTSGSERQGLECIRRGARDLRYGTDCYGYALLAAGQIDVVFEASLKPYDVQALIPIVQGAGGAISTWDGQDPAMGGCVLASGNPTLHTTLLQELST